MWRQTFEFVWRLVAFSVFLSLMFVAAGDVGYARGWWLIGAYIVMMLVNMPLVVWKNPGVIEARMRVHAGTKSFDRWFLASYSVLFAVTLVVAGADVGRFGWTVMGEWSLWLGLVLFVAGDIPMVAALCVNPFLEATVRIQEDRGHRVITTGPYRWARHPLYAGAFAFFPGMGFILGSWCAMIPIVLTLAALVWRLLREERVLMEELPGYREYAARTRYRLVPGFW